MYNYYTWLTCARLRALSPAPRHHDKGWIHRGGKPNHQNWECTFHVVCTWGRRAGRGTSCFDDLQYWIPSLSWVDHEAQETERFSKPSSSSDPKEERKRNRKFNINARMTRETNPVREKFLIGKQGPAFWMKYHVIYNDAKAAGPLHLATLC